MGRTKKRMLGALMTVSMLLGLVPATAYAEEYYGYDIWVAGEEVTSANAGNVLGDGTVSYDANANVLILDDAKINYEVKTEEGYPAAIWSEYSLEIVLEGENQISVDGEVGYALGIMVMGDLKIAGDDQEKDSLNLQVSADVNEEYGDAFAVGIMSEESISVDGASVTVQVEAAEGYAMGGGVLAMGGGAERNVSSSDTEGLFIGEDEAATLSVEAAIAYKESEPVAARLSARYGAMMMKSAVAAYEMAVFEGSTLKVQGEKGAVGAYANELYVEKGTDVEFYSEDMALGFMNDLVVSPEMVLYANDEAWDQYSCDYTEGMYVICKNMDYDGESANLEPATKVTFGPALKLTVEADEETVKPGDEVLFTITLENMMSEPLMECSLDEEYYEVYESYFQNSHIIGDYYGSGILDYSILVENIADDEQFENGYFCDAEGNPIKEIRVPRPAEPVAVAEDDMTTDDNSIVYDVETVIPVLNTDIKGFNENEDEYDRSENGFAMLFPGEKAVLYYKATVKDDAEGGKAESAAEVRTAIGYRYDNAPCLLDTDDSGEPEYNELESKFEALGEDNTLLLLNPVAKASVKVNVKEKTTQKKSVTYEKPDVEVIGEGADVYVARRFVSVFLEEGAEIAKVTVNGEEIAVSAGNRIDGLDEKDKVVIWIAVEGETPVVKEQKEIILTVGQLYAWVFDQYVTNDVAPVIRNSRTMLPARFVVEALGGAVAWNEAEQKVTITKDGDVLEIFINEPFATVNGEPVELGASAFIEADRTYLPLRFIAEYLGAEVDWNADAQVVTIIPGE